MPRRRRDAIEITQWPFPNAPGGFFRGRVLFLAGRCFFALRRLLLSGCVRHEPPADVTIINGGEPESLDPAIITGQVEIAHCPGFV